jgi:hypothetical protein
LPALQWSADLRWRVVVALSRLGAPDAQRLISSESERDPSDLGQKSGIAADAALPDAGNNECLKLRLGMTLKTATIQ